MESNTVEAVLSGIFRDAQVQALANTMRKTANGIVKIIYDKNNTEDRRHTLQGILSSVRTWNRQVIQEQTNNILRSDPNVHDQFTRAVRVFVSCWYEDEVEEKRISVRLPPFEQFVHEFLISICEDEITTSGRFETTMGMEKMMLIYSAIRNALYEVLKDQLSMATMSEGEEEIMPIEDNEEDAKVQALRQQLNKISSKRTARRPESGGVSGSASGSVRLESSSASGSVRQERGGVSGSASGSVRPERGSFRPDSGGGVGSGGSVRTEITGSEYDGGETVFDGSEDGHQMSARILSEWATPHQSNRQQYPDSTQTPRDPRKMGVGHTPGQPPSIRSVPIPQTNSVRRMSDNRSVSFRDDESIIPSHPPSVRVYESARPRRTPSSSRRPRAQVHLEGHDDD